MITRTYIEKYNTIIEGSKLNTGINPISELVYGTSVSRMLIYFDHSKLKDMVEDKVFTDMSKLRHTLRITNAGSLDMTQVHCSEISSITDDIKIRACSFDLIFFLIPELWDNGKGFDYCKNFFNQGYYGGDCGSIAYSTDRFKSVDGCNWFQPRNGYKWKEDGVYSNSTLSKEYDKFSSEEGSDIIIGRQHFDVGNENISLDITNIVNKFITGELENYGIGIAYSPMLELNSTDVENYTGFLTNKTNSFFEPYVETYYCDYISDDRSNFSLDKNNKLYLYCNIGGKLDNLDFIPSCAIDDKSYEVKQYSKGVYYIDIMLPSSEYAENTMLYDIWDNISYKGIKLKPVEMDFVIKSNSIYFNIGNAIEENNKLTPTIYGIGNNERIERGDIRKLIVLSKVNYKKNVAELVDDIYYRIYINDGTRELNIVPFEHVNKAYNENFFMVDTSVMIPYRYHIDIKYVYNMDTIMHHDVLSFDVVDKLDNKYS